MEYVSNHIKKTDVLQETPAAQFENEYTRLRRKEKRIYTDEEVALLPFIAAEHPHAAEWKCRQQSCKRLINYLQKKQTALNILEIGCGNGWLSHRLGGIPNTRVTGTDINHTEIDQASRVFSGTLNLQLLHGDIFSGNLINEKFDVIVFAASIQYFPSFGETIRSSLRLVNPGGEIHVLDSHFYLPEDIPAARRRTENYYAQMGFPEMANQYFHHDINELRSFQHHFLYKHSSFSSFFNRNSNPFTWVCLKKEEDR